MSQSIGSLRNAARVLKHDRSCYPWDTIPADTDIIYVGSGCSRNAYRIGTVVYKVQNDPYSDESNADEFDKICRIRDELPKPWTVPLANLFWVGDDPVIAMRYIKGEFPSYWPDNAEYVREEFGGADFYGSNVIVKNGRFYIVDCGCDEPASAYL